MPIINNKSKIFYPVNKQEILYQNGDQWVRQNGNPLAFDLEGNLVDQITGDKGVVNLPTVHIRHQTLKPTGEEPKWRIEFRNNILKPILDYFTPEQSYYDSQDPYEFDTEKRFRYTNWYMGKDRLQNMGMVKTTKDGQPHYYYPNPEFKQDIDSLKEELLDFIGEDTKKYKRELQGCAANANLVNRYFRKPTAGDAWTRHGIFGDSDIVVNPNVNKRDLPSWLRLFKNGKLQSYIINKLNSDYVSKHIDEHQLENGDIVDMSFSRSNYQDDAYKDGDYNRANTHTGTILRTGRDKKDTYVIHYMGNGIRVDPIGDLLRQKRGLSITGIRRPFSSK